MMTTRRWLAIGLLGLATTAYAQDSKTSKGKDREQKGEGVVVSVEPIEKVETKNDDGPKKVRVTINTAAVWRDFVRDQADEKRKTEAKKGEGSVATKGQPLVESETIVAEVDRDTTLHLRYRSSTDEADNGSRSVEKAAKKDGSPESNEVKTSRRDEKAPKIAIKDLKAGLFVSIETEKGKARKLTVLKPVGEGTTPASEAKPEK